jgi:pilus assembly protein CpaE
MKFKILVVDDEPITRKMVSTILEKNGFSAATAENGRDCLRQLPSLKPDLILLDVMMPEMDGYETCSQIRSNPDTANLPIIMLTALDTIEQKVKGFETGADDYLPKPFNTEELLAHIHALLRIVQPSQVNKDEKFTPTTLAVFSLRGGSGVTSISVNLAAGLAQLWDMDVALVDMVPVAGQSALFLNQTLKTTWSDLARKNTVDIDDQAILPVLLPHSSRVFTLASPLKPEDGDLITSQKTEKVISTLTSHFPYVVIDLPHTLSDTTLSCLDQADTIILILQPEIASIRAGKMALDIFSALDYTDKRIFYVLNWSFPRLGLGLEDIERFTKHKMDLIIPYAPDEFITGLNYGKPPVLAAPDKPLGAIFEDLAFTLSSENHRKLTPKKPTPSWTRINERKKLKK